MKKIVFLTGTRADFGKMRSIILSIIKTKKFKVDVFVTGMHLMKEYGNTIEEIKKVGIKNLFKFRNQKLNYNNKVRMDLIFSKTIEGFSKYVKTNKPDLIMLHGDRLEAFAGAVVGAYNNILVGHIEGGEVSGTIDNSIRHSISKLSHLHFVSNISHKKRLIQLGELKKNIFVIGSPDIDIMVSKKLPSILKVKKQYKIYFKDFSILIFHPVTTEVDKVSKQTNLLINSLIEKVRSGTIKELIFALSSTMEGDTTNFYIFKQIQDMEVVISTIARGISVGDELEYADEVTLGRAFEGRRSFS